MEMKSALKKIRENGKGGTYIYGAGKIASSVVQELDRNNLRECIKGFLVSNIEDNPSHILGLPVEDVHVCMDLSDKVIFVAVGKKYQESVLAVLKEYAPDSEIICIHPYALYIMSQQANIKEGKGLIDELFDNRYYYSEDSRDVTYGELHMQTGTGNGNRDFYVKLDPVFVVRDFHLYKKRWRNYNLLDEYNKVFGREYRLSSIEEGYNANLSEIKSKVKLYMVTSHLDNPSSFKDEDVLIPIQAGAALTDIKKYDVRDDIGDNISDRNKTLCELTAIYWIWKNSHDTEYKGLCHYRRHFDLENKDFGRILNNDIDAVLTTPRFNAIGNINTFLYARFIEPIDVEIVKEYIKEYYPEYTEDMEEHFNQNFFYNCNMVIAKEKVFNEYCKFLFDVILTLDSYFSDETIQRTNKYSAYFAELITSLFFYHNRDKLKIATSDFCFYE